MFLAVAVVVLNNIVAFMFSTWLTEPLKSIRALAEEVVQITFQNSDVKDSKNREKDYSKIINSKLLVTDRTDEIGALLTSFKDMITTLNDECNRRLCGDCRHQNPFYLPLSEPQVFTWQEFSIRGSKLWNDDLASERVSNTNQRRSRRRLVNNNSNEKSFSMSSKKHSLYPFKPGSAESRDSIFQKRSANSKDSQNVPMSSTVLHRLSRLSIGRASAASSSADTSSSHTLKALISK